MPGFDRTGPMSTGSMTGGARGLCNPANAGYNARFTRDSGSGKGPGLRRGFRGGYGPGRGRGFVSGYRGSPPAAVSAYSTGTSDEMNRLKADAGYLKTSLDAINKRIEELERKPAESS